MDKSWTTHCGRLWIKVVRGLKSFEALVVDACLKRIGRFLARRHETFEDDPLKQASRVLILDDHVPDAGITTAREVYDTYNKVFRNPSTAQSFAFVFKLINQLKLSGYQVDTTDSPQRAIQQLKDNSYSTILMDLGWYDAEQHKYDYSRKEGWKLVEQIKCHSPAPVILLSSRLYDDRGLAGRAFNQHLFPVLKSYDDECIKQIVVNLRTFTTSSSLEDVLKTRPRLLAVRMYNRLSGVLSYSLGCSLVLLASSFAILFYRADLIAFSLSLVVGLITVLNYVIHRQATLSQEAMLAD